MTSANRGRIRLQIHGRVQGVFFRAGTQEEAVRLNLTGWVRNLPDGCVEVVAEGDRAALENLAEWCRHGPPYARVTRVDVSEEPPTGEFSGFETRYY